MNQQTEPPSNRVNANIVLNDLLAPVSQLHAMIENIVGESFEHGFSLLSEDEQHWYLMAVAEYARTIKTTVDEATRAN